MKFTTVTQLDPNQNKDIIAYFEKTVRLYNLVKRYTFYEYKYCKCDGRKFNKSKFNTHLQKKYGITKRTADSIMNDAIGAYNACIELRKYEINQIDSKVEKLNKEIEKLEKQRLIYAKYLIGNSQDKEVVFKQRDLKKKIFSKRRKIDKLNSRKNNCETQIQTKNVKLCFGTKKLLRKDVTMFKEHRDSQQFFVGTKSETQCNQQCQLFYNKRNNQFKIKLRKDYGFDEDEKFVWGKCHFNYQLSLIKKALKTHSGPLTYRIIRNNGRYYLYCIFEIKWDDEEFITDKNNGTIGVDFNKGFIAYTETDKHGNMLDCGKLNYRFAKGGRTRSDLYDISNELCKIACRTNKTIVIEDLDFSKKKSRAVKKNSKENRKYNHMMHSLSYKTFDKIMTSVSYRNKVRLIKVNPAWTSWIAEHKYCKQMKLNDHVGASFVIARRGQGFKEAKIN